MWRGGIYTRPARYRKGDDGFCFAIALAAVRRWGEIIEHPRGSGAWEHFGLRLPPPQGGWLLADAAGGYTCHIHQANYGHQASKPTWLYAHGIKLPPLRWRYEPGRTYVTRAMKFKPPPPLFPLPKTNTRHQTKKQRNATPSEFLDLLIALATAPAPPPATLFDLAAETTAPQP